MTLSGQSRSPKSCRGSVHPIEVAATALRLELRRQAKQLVSSLSMTQRRSCGRSTHEDAGKVDYFQRDGSRPQKYAKIAAHLRKKEDVPMTLAARPAATWRSLWR